MKLLILTQKIDRDDTILGFFHSWVREFAMRSEKVTVIALGVGEYDFPGNVRVLSLGKEEKTHSRFQYVCRFYWHIWRERKNYDTVFVHMNDEYVVLGGWLWRLLGKKICHWRNHPKGGWMIDVAMKFSHQVYATSMFAYVNRAYPDRVCLMPVGIDTDVFSPDPTISKIPHSILFLSRLSPIKKPHLLIEAVRILKERRVSGVVHIVGDPHNPEDYAYAEHLKDLILRYELGDMITITPGIANRETPSLYRQYEIFVNLTTTGSFDKTIFEAMVSGLLVATSNRALEGAIADVFLVKENDPHDLAQCLEHLLSLSREKRFAHSAELQEYVEHEHSLKELMRRLFVPGLKTSIIG